MPFFDRGFYTLKIEATSSSETWILQDPYGAISQKKTNFIVTAVKTSNPTFLNTYAQLYIWAAMFVEVEHKAGVSRVEKTAVQET
jgi:hypothetical protein